jgi:signal transduction histidine kinase
VATVSHELRTPLTSIIGYGEILQAQWNVLSDEKRREWLSRIVLSANRQKKLVSDLLLLSRMEHELADVSPSATNVALAVGRAIDEIRGAYAGQSVDASGPPEALAHADLSRTIQIMTNLLDNAAKYSPPGSTIRVSWELDDHAIVVRVRDEGPGIPADGLNLLFTRFGRIPGSSMRAGHVGTGLGLYLGKLWAQAMGGDLLLEETGPHGSVFVLRLLPVVGDEVLEMHDPAGRSVSVAS